VVDSVKVSDSTKITDSLKVTYTSKLLVFPSLKIKSYWIAFTFRTIKSKTSLRLGFRLFWTRKNDYFTSVKKIIKIGFPMLPILRSGILALI
jgi:hypothetical protein